ncbi:GTP-binding protein [Oceaniferula spumae]|uniref:GTP-binding protein n=1 Tax=Oceaniferula spumae TaxID=2979115 RepID=A0AAT9FKH2_9BACT
MSLLFKDESYALRGACFEVYKDKGSGFLEDVYQECLEIEFTLQGIPFAAQSPLGLSYKGKPLRQSYKPDFICYDEIILEIKAAKNIDDTHRAQVHNYLKATNKRLGLLINFGHHPKVQIERIIH